jgi:hypothetical protein
MFSLADGRVKFLAPEFGGTIEGLGIRGFSWFENP